MWRSEACVGAWSLDPLETEQAMIYKGALVRGCECHCQLSQDASIHCSLHGAPSGCSCLWWGGDPLKAPATAGP